MRARCMHVYAGRSRGGFCTAVTARSVFRLREIPDIVRDAKEIPRDPTWRVIFFLSARGGENASCS